MADCCNSFVIRTIPFEIRVKGRYFVNKNLIYAGSAAAITVRVSGVTIDFCQNHLSLTNAAATAVLVTGVDDVNVKNGSISVLSRSGNETSIGVSVVNSRKVTIDNILVKETGYGVLVEASQDVLANRFHAQNNGLANFRANNSIGVTVVNSVFDNVVDDLGVAGVRFDDNIDVQFKQNNLHNSDIFARSGNNYLFDQNSLLIDDPAYPFGVFQVGTTAASINNVTVQNSNFANTNSLDAGPAGVFIVSGHNFLFENCNVECNRTGSEPLETAVVAVAGSAAFPTLFAVAPDIPVTNLRFVNSNIVGVATYGILVAGDLETNIINKNIIFDNVNVSDSLANVDIFSTKGVTIKNSNITNGLEAVVLESNSSYNSLLNNTINSNFSTGILLEAGTRGNNIRGNNIFNNNAGIIDNGSNNQSDNIVYDNSALIGETAAKKVSKLNNKKYEKSGIKQ